MSRPLSDYDVLSFDCYGTLIDWERGLWDAYQPLLMAQSGDAPGREALLVAHGRHESRLEEERPGERYERILERVHAGVANDLDLVTTPELDRAFGASVPHWPAFLDTAEALRELKQRYRLVILSNVSREGIAASNQKLGVTFDAIYTAEDIGSYKPNPRNFAWLLDHLEQDHGVSAERVLHVAQSLFHDHVPARAMGMDTVWIDRQRLSEGGSWGATAEVGTRPEIEHIYFSMGAFATATRPR